MVEIKVNTFKEKRALKSLELALGCLGVTLDDIKNVSSLIKENNALKSENAELKRINASQGKDEIDGKSISQWIKAAEEMDRKGE